MTTTTAHGRRITTRTLPLDGATVETEATRHGVWLIVTDTTGARTLTFLVGGQPGDVTRTLTQSIADHHALREG